MKKLPNIRWKVTDAGHMDRLRHWFKEREMGLQSEEEGASGLVAMRAGPRAGGPLDGLVAPFDKAPPKRGEIRLLSAWSLPEAPRPVYVLVLADWEDDLKLIAPFGPITEPATAGELRTGRNALALRVLCLWNTHSVPAARLAWSWVVDHMSESELAEAWAVFRHAATGAPVDASLEGRIGIPIFNEQDPRIAYQNEEAALMAPLAEPLHVQATEGETVSLDELVDEFQKEDFALAAAGEYVPSAVECFEVPAKNVSVKVHREQDLRSVTLFVHDAAGEPASILDGAEVVDRGGRPLAEIRRSFATFPFAAAASGIGLRSSGERLQLVRR